MSGRQVSKRKRGEIRVPRARLDNIVAGLDKESGIVEDNPDRRHLKSKQVRQLGSLPVVSLFQANPELTERSYEQVMDIIQDVAHATVEHDEWRELRDSMTDEELAREAEEMGIELHDEARIIASIAGRCSIREGQY